jgi:hypothetical protein
MLRRVYLFALQALSALTSRIYWERPTSHSRLIGLRLVQGDGRGKRTTTRNCIANAGKRTTTRYSTAGDCCANCNESWTRMLQTNAGSCNRMLLQRMLKAHQRLRLQLLALQT